jgi:hypothetical protein
MNDNMPEQAEPQTKEEFLAALADDPVTAMTWLKALYAHSQSWFATNTLATREEGVTDATHHVTEIVDNNDNIVGYQQFELQNDPGSRFYSLGFTDAEYAQWLLAENTQ